MADQLYAQLHQRIASGRWAEGTRIPSELELARDFSVSRPIVREALARLRVESIIDSRRGSGSIVIKSTRPLVGGFRPIESIADLIQSFEFRLSLECDAASYAAARHDVAQLTNIKNASQEITDNMDDDAFGDADFGFHSTIAEASNNEMFVSAMSMLHQQILVGMRLAGNLATGVASRTSTVLDEHEKIVSCIGERDSKGASAAMMRHLTSSRYRLLGNADYKIFSDSSPGNKRREEEVTT